jgi:hypothetical protein
VLLNYGSNYGSKGKDSFEDYALINPNKSIIGIRSAVKCHSPTSGYYKTLRYCTLFLSVHEPRRIIPSIIDETR